MTQLRPPLSFAAATRRIAGVIDWPVAARIVRRSARAVRYWSEDSCKTTPTLVQALALDAAYAEAGGQGAPYQEAYAFLLGVQLNEQDASRRELASELATAARESGEAFALTLTVSATHASPRDTMRALAEADQAHTAWGAVRRRLKTFLPAGAGPVARQSGGIL